MDDFLFLGCCYLSGIDSQSYTVLFSKMTEDGLFLGGGGVLPKRPNASVGVPADEVVGVEFDNARRNHIKEILNFRFRS